MWLPDRENAGDVVFDAKKDLISIVKRSTSSGEVMLSSGRKSDFYVDARMVTLGARGAWLTATLILETIEAADFDFVGGPALGADPIVGAVAAVSWQMGRPVNTFIVRGAPKQYGKMREIEGPLSEGASVILVDDVLTTGGSILKAAEAVERFGCDIVKIVVLVDRQEGGVEALAAEGHKVDAILTKADVLG